RKVCAVFAQGLVIDHAGTLACAEARRRVQRDILLCTSLYPGKQPWSTAQARVLACRSGLAARTIWGLPRRSHGGRKMRTLRGQPRRTANALFGVLALSLSLFGQLAPAGALELPRGELKVSLSSTRANTVLLSWTGPVMAPMASQIRDAFETRKGQASRFLLRVSSYGGSVAEGERVIEVLRRIKATHELETTVLQGDVCASMCVFIYVQGQKRYGALTSSWLFHEVSHTDPVTKQT